jgi:phage terminase Nu1 subunit (DNA packaging protein)
MILNGWKEIAAYINSSVRTVQRWEREGMPVARPLRSSRGSVIAYSEQLDSWLRRRSDLQANRVIAGLNTDARRGRDYQQTLSQARRLKQQLQATRLQMTGHMSLLRAELDRLKQNVTRMTLAGAPKAGVPRRERLILPISSGELSDPTVNAAASFRLKTEA